MILVLLSSLVYMLSTILIGDGNGLVENGDGDWLVVEDEPSNYIREGINETETQSEQQRDRETD